MCVCCVFSVLKKNFLWRLSVDFFSRYYREKYKMGPRVVIDVFVPVRGY